MRGDQLLNLKLNTTHPAQITSTKSKFKNRKKLMT